jgi:hypothetical protein
MTAVQDKTGCRFAQHPVFTQGKIGRILVPWQWPFCRSGQFYTLPSEFTDEGYLFFTAVFS